MGLRANWFGEIHAPAPQWSRHTSMCLPPPAAYVCVLDKLNPVTSEVGDVLHMKAGPALAEGSPVP